MDHRVRCERAAAKTVEVSEVTLLDVRPRGSREPQNRVAPTNELRNQL